jgi:type IV pilus assembly protein PilM
MAFSVLPTQLSPIAVDIGTSSLKVLQVVLGDVPAIHAAAELEIPDTIRFDSDHRHSFFEQELPGLFKAKGFKGKRVTCSPLASQILMQPIQIERGESKNHSEIVTAQLEAQLERMPGSLVVRSHSIAETLKDGRAATEMLCWAMTHEDAMRHLTLFKSMKLKLVGLHPQARAIVGAFDHLNRRTSDSETTTMYVDLGWGGMKIAIAHGSKMIFGKQVQIGGRQLDGLISERSGTDLFTARMRRISESRQDETSPASTARERVSPPVDGLAMLRAGLARDGFNGEIPQPIQESAAVATDRRNGVQPPELVAGISPTGGSMITAGVDCSELLESMSDELSLCMRYHSAVFSGRRVDRLIFLGGESRSTSLCRGLAKSLNISAQLGDPMARYASGPNDPTLPEPGHVSPAWAVACGLCTAPVDL